MAHIAFPQWAKTITTVSTNTYSYVYIAPKTTTYSTLLFLHGFPSSCYDWRHQIKYYSIHGYGILAPDLLGYGGTDKPDSLHHYRAKTMCDSLIEIMDHEHIDRVHAVGHDMGCGLLSRLANYFPHRLLSCTFLTVPYAKPGEKFDLQAVNAMTSQFFGFERFGYIEFFVREGSGKIIDEHIDSFFSLFYPHDAEVWSRNLAPIGAIESWLRADTKAPLPSFITTEEKETHCQILHGYYDKAVNWYRALANNINIEDELNENLDPMLHMPVLVITEQPSAISIPGFAEQMKQFADDVRFKQVKTNGHWVQLEARDEVNSMIQEFIHEVC
ncbi:putative epoxide hydrolase [Talaromyces proteolyticus]|uniref:Epoxide hydrolase n=1 Tax=Talaromyces proteolyticus TaxID=1131652 RepID=A0AAD4KT66_9EURO|nr:putative epoxide hydrolase [Talaromyces proteolyticus]KAH8696405.1 putative epoxide hydrolase [Talaromyces proteolyticus]